MALLWEIVEAIERVVELPAVCMPGMVQVSRPASPLEAARELREQWKLPSGPLPHLLRHAEARGIVVCLLHELSRVRQEWPQIISAALGM